MLIQQVAALVILGSGLLHPGTGPGWQAAGGPPMAPVPRAATWQAAQESTAGLEQTTATTEAKPQKKAKKNKKKSDAVAPDEPRDADQAAAQVDQGGGHFVWKQHPSIRFGKVFRLDFQAKLQEDAHGSYAGAKGLACPNTALPSTCLWELHRNRVGIEGNFFKHIEYEAERELTEQELTEKDLLAGYTLGTPWKDVDVNVTYLNNFQVQMGRFKIPFGLDELTGDSHNDFAYRSLGASNLAPARDTGVMVHGRFFKRGLSYSTGVFRHDGDNARSKKIQGGDRTFAARVTGTPFRRLNRGMFSGLELGTSLSISSVSNDSYRPNGLRGRTLFNQDMFYEPVYVNGHRRRWEGDFDWLMGPASIRSEVTWMTDDRLKQGLGDQDLPAARARSWYVAGTWILTGEPKTRPVKAAYELLRGGFGAMEAVARFERLWFDSAGGGSAATWSTNPRTESIFPRGEKALTLGVNWTLNRWVKMQFNGIRERLEDPETNPGTNGGAFWSRVLRFQFVL